MYDFEITHISGVKSFVRATNRSIAIRMFLEAEGVSMEYFENHYTIRRMKKEKRYEESTSTNQETE